MFFRAASLKRREDYHTQYLKERLAMRIWMFSQKLLVVVDDALVNGVVAEKRQRLKQSGQ